MWGARYTQQNVVFLDAKKKKKKANLGVKCRSIPLLFSKVLVILGSEATAKGPTVYISFLTAALPLPQPLNNQKRGGQEIF